MCSFSFLLAYLMIIGSIAFSQGQQNSKNNLVIYDPKSEKQTTAVDFGASADDGVSLVDLPIYWVPCTCAQLQCNCCIGIRLRNQNIDKKVCIQATFIFPTMRLRIQIRLENRTLLNFSVSVLEPPAICIPTFLPVPLYICFKIYDIVLPIGTDFEGCFSLLLRIVTQTIYELKLGCVRLEADGLRYFRQPLVEDIVSKEDYRQDIIRGNNDGISLESTRW